MFNVTSQLAHSFGITTLECDNCHARKNIKHKPEIPHWELKRSNRPSAKSMGMVSATPNVLSK